MGVRTELLVEVLRRGGLGGDDGDGGCKFLCVAGSVCKGWHHAAFGAAQVSLPLILQTGPWAGLPLLLRCLVLPGGGGAAARQALASGTCNSV